MASIAGSVVSWRSKIIIVLFEVGVGLLVSVPLVVAIEQQQWKGAGLAVVAPPTRGKDPAATAGAWPASRLAAESRLKPRPYRR